jgi:hypothetical protein
VTLIFFLSVAPAKKGRQSSSLGMIYYIIMSWRALTVKLNLIIEMLTLNNASCLPVISHTKAAR